MELSPTLNQVEDGLIMVVIMEAVSESPRLRLNKGAEIFLVSENLYALQTVNVN